MEYWNQHFVTEAYLKAWHDPQTPNGSYVWIVSKKRCIVYKKSPKTLFTETDFYTVYDSADNRIVELEHKLKEIEDKFILLRDKKLQNHRPLTPNDRLTIVLFVSSMFARTKFQRDVQREIWQELLDSVDELPREIASIIKETPEYKRIARLHQQPMPSHIFLFVNIVRPILLRMNCTIYETTIQPGFITSDNPCLWIDPSILYPNEPVTWFGLGSPILEIILPISPKQCIRLVRRGPDGYHVADKEITEAVEALVVANAEEYIVVNQKFFKEEWFEKGSTQSPK